MAVTTILAPMFLIATLVMSPGDADQMFAALETRLLQAEEVRLDVQITATGAVSAEYEGTFQVDKQGMSLKQDGHFMKAESHLHLSAGQNTLQFGNGAQSKKVDQPVFLAEAMWIGLTRMGLLHNLARLHAGQGPDHAEGGVNDWVRVHNFEVLEDKTFMEREMMRIKFDIRVSKIPVGSATIWIDKQTGLPCLREQVVRFPEGEMVVRETYKTFVIQDGMVSAQKH
ncbi:hypothetical protein [Acanthopleuribacter pedis]|uniref:Outer membrane lipoprotein carrier protein LolA n=1 Tax=Acanthopleuribacter pedis TaxID=442870 RepID=A0A8J7Q7H7_9BACT|nr:hypothetical protein [Acanthopleuribacter pedis]MBO1318744.1 hypothetical protein [Acanthopleuribacter pedis]